MKICLLAFHEKKAGFLIQNCEISIPKCSKIRDIKKLQGFIVQFQKQVSQRLFEYNKPTKLRSSVKQKPSKHFCSAWELQENSLTKIQETSARS